MKEPRPETSRPAETTENQSAFQPSTSLVMQNRPTRESGTLTPTRALIGSFGMSNVLSEVEKQQVMALENLGWHVRSIEQATGIRREQQ